jgi:hypothetical protein
MSKLYTYQFARYELKDRDHLESAEYFVAFEVYPVLSTPIQCESLKAICNFMKWVEARELDGPISGEELIWSIYGENGYGEQECLGDFKEFERANELAKAIAGPNVRCQENRFSFQT